MSNHADRRTNAALRQRLDHLLARVRESRAEIVERGLSAVHLSKATDPSPTCERASAAALGPRRGAH
jgi:hypothetical protein